MIGFWETKKTNIYLGKITTLLLHSRHLSSRPCYCCRLHSDPSLRQWVVQVAEDSVQWFLSAIPCFSLIHEPLLLWGHACSTTEQLLLWSSCSLCSLLPCILLFFLKYVFTGAPQTPLNGLALASGGSIAKLAGNSCVWHRAAPELFPQRPPWSHLCH